MFRTNAAFVLFGLLLMASPAGAAPATQPIDAAFDAKLQDIDARAAQVQDYTAHFEQHKYTALLRKPLISSGTVRKLGPVDRWDTEKPEPAVLHADGKEVKLYYPKQNLVEVYPIDKRMADLAASPRLSRSRRRR
jgi:outer membrane lipoprotein-sorting protein